MAPKKEAKSGGALNLLGGLLGKLFEFAGAGAQLLSGLRDAVEGRAEAVLARLALRVLLQLWISAGIFVALLGLFFLLIDSAAISRGLVFLVGGALIALVCLLLARFARKGMADEFN